jgi:hypothetical protein
MRRVVFALILLLVTASAATGVHASTDCERWLKEYKESLAHSPAVQKARAAGHRLHHYVHRQLAAFHKPKPASKPHVLPVHHKHKPMSREEMLRRVELACGFLPDDLPLTAKLPTAPPPTFSPERSLDVWTMELAQNDGTPLLPMIATPLYGGSGSTYPGASYFLPLVGGGPGPYGGGGVPPKIPNTTESSNPPPPAPPIVPTPEPGSVVLMLTGLSGGVVEVVRRRRARRA